MLVLSRRERQKVLIGDDVSIEVLPSKNGQVRLGIVAPPSVRVDRQEVALARARQAAGDDDQAPPRRPAA